MVLLVLCCYEAGAAGQMSTGLAGGGGWNWLVVKHFISGRALMLANISGELPVYNRGGGAAPLPLPLGGCLCKERPAAGITGRSWFPARAPVLQGHIICIHNSHKI